MMDVAILDVLETERTISGRLYTFTFPPIPQGHKINKRIAALPSANNLKPVISGKIPQVLPSLIALA